MSRSAPEAKVYSRHFYSLDVLRGVAAIGIVFYHWHHFFTYGTVLDSNFQPTSQPFYVLLWPFYVQGWRAVDLFFTLSGFIFYWLYSDAIEEKKTSPREFAVLRFSRIYPLHFLTLLFVAVAQLIMLHRFGAFFFYSDNDLHHFILQLFLASSWGHDKDFSFNAPVWSVSVEAFLYGLFLIVCSLRWNRWWHLALFASAASLISQFVDSILCEGALCFFLGGLTYRLFLQIWPRRFSSLSIVTLVFLTALMWIAIPFNFEHDVIYNHFRESLWWSPLHVAHKDVVGVISTKLTQNSYDLLLFPLTILTLAVCEAHCGTLGKRLSFLGDISYSTYLIHFPLQLVVVMGSLLLQIPPTAFYSPWMMLAFFAVLIPLALASYHLVERPAQIFLRIRLLRPRDAKPAVAAVPTPGS